MKCEIIALPLLYTGVRICPACCKCRATQRPALYTRVQAILREQTSEGGPGMVRIKPHAWEVPAVASPDGMSAAGSTEGSRLPSPAPVTSVVAAAMPTPLLARVCAPHLEQRGLGHGGAINTCAAVRGREAAGGRSSSSPGLASLRTGHGHCPALRLQLRGCLLAARGCFPGWEAALSAAAAGGCGLGPAARPGAGVPLDGSAGPAERPSRPGACSEPGASARTSVLLSGHSCRQHFARYLPIC